jgi:hypothetical protein
MKKMIIHFVFGKDMLCLFFHAFILFVCVLGFYGLLFATFV